ncbi:MAG: serine/threonine protein kinase [Deltaproteobacteria bacterium]|jgi:serine/threonine-protein kinase|nr:serine/threonine protein kinase [Deltaproteobacteria bacterium]MBW2533595.1 serine/threonine protein kinase [Deltaproteobacteria bacterium]
MGFNVGDVIEDRYEILEEIGTGGHGTVFRAEDRDLASPVAIKVLHDHIAEDDVFVRRMKREARVMGQLSGTSAVQVMAVHRTAAGGMYLVMEYLEGRDLGRHLWQWEKRDEQIPTAELLELLEPIATTLEAAHVRKIIHRDLKLANIYVLAHAARGRVRLLDFGLAKDLKMSALTQPGTVTGSPAYIAPEAWRGKPELVDHRVDVYGLGVVLYRALAKRFPFEPNRPLAEIVTEVMTKPRPRLTAARPDLPVEIDQWAERALAIKAEDRFQSVQAMWFVLRGILAGGPAPDHP